MSELPRRKSPRLTEFDYAHGWYFVTICTDKRREILGTIVGGDAHIAPHTELSACGCIADEYIRRIPGIDTYVIMPNHIHMVIRIGMAMENGAMWASPPTKTLGSLVRSFKTLVTKAAGQKVWQRSYYDHVIRNEADYLRIWQYMDSNPAHWTEDDYYQT